MLVSRSFRSLVARRSSETVSISAIRVIFLLYSSISSFIKVANFYNFVEFNILASVRNCYMSVNIRKR